MVKRAQSEGYCPSEDAALIAVAIVSMFNQFCYVQLSGKTTDVDDDACIATLANIFYRAVYCKEAT